MVEPTESENRDMLDKYCDALIGVYVCGNADSYRCVCVCVCSNANSYRCVCVCVCVLCYKILYIAPPPSILY